MTTWLSWRAGTSALVLGSALSNCNPAAASGHGAPDASTADGPIGVDGPSADTASGAEACPNLGLITADPEEVPVGDEIDVSVLVAPADAGGLSYTWTATSGEFLSVIAPKTRFSCTAPGPATLTVEVVGGDEPDGSSCVQQTSVTVQCDVVEASPPPFSCTGSANGLCSSTESAFVSFDPTGGCYSCLLANGCIDDVATGVAGAECDDLVGDADGGPAIGAWKPSLCLMTVACILQNACADPSVIGCYCGGAAGSECAGSGAANGACLTEENAGLETTDPATALETFDSKSLPGGVANAIFACAAAHGCGSCLPKTDAGPEADEASDP